MTRNVNLIVITELSIVLVQKYVESILQLTKLGVSAKNIIQELIVLSVMVFIFVIVTEHAVLQVVDQSVHVQATGQETTVHNVWKGIFFREAIVFKIAVQPVETFLVTEVVSSPDLKWNVCVIPDGQALRQFSLLRLPRNAVCAIQQIHLQADVLNDR